MHRSKTSRRKQPRPAGGLEELARRLAARDGPVRLCGLRGSARALAVAELARAHGERPLLVLVPSARAGDVFIDDLRGMLGERGESGRVRLFPRHDIQPYERFSPQPFVLAQRMDLLYRWLASARPDAGSREPAPIAVAPWTALALRVPARGSVRSRSVHLEVGQTLDRDALVATLVAAGYTRMPLVEERGEIAVRGGILDVFPPNRSHPVRVELLGDEVESIREFDAATQRSQDKLVYVVAPPPRELLIDRSQVIRRSDALRELADEQGVAPAAVDELVDALLRGHQPPGVEALAPALQPDLETVFDFLPEDTLVAVDDREAGLARLASRAQEMQENFRMAVEGGRVVSPPAALTLSPDEILAAVEARGPIWLERLEVDSDLGAPGGAELPQVSLRARPNDELRQALAAARTGERALLPLVERLEQWQQERWRVVLAVSSLSHAERLRALLQDYGIRARCVTDARPAWRWATPGRPEVRTTPLSEGFVLEAERLAVVTEEEIFGPRERRRHRGRWPEGAAVEGIEKLSAGDALVHREHGIGTYRGLVELDVGGGRGEFLRLEYEGGDRLFVPVHRLNLVQRYAGSDGHTPRLDRLGGQSWERAKKSVRKALRSMAHELLAVHAARELAPGHAFSPRDHLLEEFEAAFPFEETPDQLAAIEDVLAGLQLPKPMDRLVCGDVGYGKTEVAIRGAFRVVMDGHQVAFLVPTTILCQQHEETLRKRFEGYPVRIESLSRFSRPAHARAVLEGLADGKVDIVVGTHRLLQKSVRFRSLGLLVIDEEQRFGVTHKEKIKQLRKTVDVVTLTATPIPRTLQQAFTGLRELSVIDTPPADRMAIRTHVCRFSESLVREAILREVRRGGQVFFVHNRVQTIGSMAELLERVVPEVKVLVAHGQMRERDLEERMLAFLHGEAEVLLCTTIIESGLDIPRANTILVNRADRLGLAQLYQLRGRVGRSSQRAYAYLMIPGVEGLSGDAERRLDAIQELSALGSGFRLANMDLEIRGAGNLIGAEQSGHLAAVGYETYMEMLQDTIAELRGQKLEQEVDPEIRLPIVARLPEDYVAVVNQRLVLYKRLASCRDDAEIDRIRDELLDRFGPLPEEAENLLGVIRLKILAQQLGVASIETARGELVLTAAESTRIDPQRLVNLLTQAGGGLRVAPNHRIHAPLPPGRSRAPRELFESTRRLLLNLGAAA